MKPCGVERDREVAEAKGLELVYVNQRGHQQWQIKTGKAGFGMGFPRKKVPAWSTDISASFELWEEMKVGEKVLKVILRAVPGFVICLIELPWGKEIGANGKTEADAISGAWLKWKEATHESQEDGG